LTKQTKHICDQRGIACLVKVGSSKAGERSEEILTCMKEECKIYKNYKM